MKKLDLVKYIALGAKTLSELQKGRFDTVQQKHILRKAAQEAAGLTYNKALNFATNLVLPREGELEKVANRLKASELEVIAKHIDAEILRVKASLKEKEEVAATTEEVNEIESDDTAMTGIHEARGVAASIRYVLKKAGYKVARQDLNVPNSISVSCPTPHNWMATIYINQHGEKGYCVKEVDSELFEVLKKFNPQKHTFAGTTYIKVNVRQS